MPVRTYFKRHINLNLIILQNNLLKMPVYSLFSDMDTLQVCVVQSLEKCEESTPANLVESMFKFVRNETPCVNFTSVSFDFDHFPKSTDSN